MSFVTTLCKAVIVLGVANGLGRYIGHESMERHANKVAEEDETLRELLARKEKSCTSN